MVRLVGLEPTRYISTNGLTKAQAPMETRNDALVKSVAPTYYATSARTAQLGFEPRTYRLTADCSTVELLGHKERTKSPLLTFYKYYTKNLKESQNSVTRKD